MSYEKERKFENRVNKEIKKHNFKYVKGVDTTLQCFDFRIDFKNNSCCWNNKPPFYYTDEEKINCIIRQCNRYELKETKSYYIDYIQKELELIINERNENLYKIQNDELEYIEDVSPIYTIEMNYIEIDDNDLMFGCNYIEDSDYLNYTIYDFKRYTREHLVYEIYSIIENYEYEVWSIHNEI